MHSLLYRVSEKEHKSATQAISCQSPGRSHSADNDGRGGVTLVLKLVLKLGVPWSLSYHKCHVPGSHSQVKSTLKGACVSEHIQTFPLLKRHSEIAIYSAFMLYSTLNIAYRWPKVCGKMCAGHLQTPHSFT